jgi:hypothetical protein
MLHLAAVEDGGPLPLRPHHCRKCPRQKVHGDHGPDFVIQRMRSCEGKCKSALAFSWQARPACRQGATESRWWVHAAQHRDHPCFRDGTNVVLPFDGSPRVDSDDETEMLAALPKLNSRYRAGDWAPIVQSVLPRRLLSNSISPSGSAPRTRVTPVTSLCRAVHRIPVFTRDSAPGQNLCNSKGDLHAGE